MSSRKDCFKYYVENNRLKINDIFSELPTKVLFEKEKFQ